MSETSEAVRTRLQTHPFFADLPTDLLTLVSQHAAPFEADAGGLLLQQGQPADAFFAIESGRVAIAVHAPQKGLVTIETVEPGEIVGWSWLFPPHRWTFDAVAQTEVGGIRIDACALRPRLAEDPRNGYALLGGISAVMADRLQSSRLRLLDLYGDHHDSA